MAATKPVTGQPNEIIKVQPLTSVENCLQLLERHKLTALPVQQGATYIGFVTLFDLLHFIAFQPVFTSKQNKAVVDKSLLQKTAKEVIDFCPESSALHILLPNEPLARVMKVFQSTHRALVVLENSERILTQIDLLRFALANESNFGSVWAMTAEHVVGALSKPGSEHNPAKPVTIMDSTHAITGLKKMFLHRVNAVGVVNDKNKLVASLNASDLKGLSYHNIDHLDKPVLLFLEAVHHRVPTPNKCSKSASLKTVVERLLEFGTHRIWVVGDQDVPFGVITMSDLIGLLASKMV